MSNASLGGRLEAHDSQAGKEKNFVALTSVLAAIFLTTMKIIVGIMTGSLGILAEAAHSALDLIAALVTLFAVRVSGRPADPEHTYGHGKIENLSALFETVLLLVTCAWIIYEAIQRLFFKSVAVEVSIWAFIVMAVSIIIDFSRSRALGRAAKKWDSQALEADALHFSTDIWSSAVVIAGLGLVLISDRFGIPWLAKADSVAALGVAGIVVYVSVQLGRRTVQGLLDAVPSGLLEEVTCAAKVPGVLEVRRVRVRRSGPEAFADITLAVSRDMPLEQAHGVATEAEAAVRNVVPGADVVVHVDPIRSQDEAMVSTVRVLAAKHGLGAHGIRVYDVLGIRNIELHVEVSSSLTLEEAHAQATAFEKALRETMPQVDRVVTHIEPVDGSIPARRAEPDDVARVVSLLQAVSDETQLDFRPHDVKVQQDDGQLSVSFHCRLDGSESIAEAHHVTEEIEGAMRHHMPELGRVIIHVEPSGERDT